jgi:hypothetical protein
MDLLDPKSEAPETQLKRLSRRVTSLMKATQVSQAAWGESELAPGTLHAAQPPPWTRAPGKGAAESAESVDLAASVRAATVLTSSTSVLTSLGSGYGMLIGYDRRFDWSALTHPTICSKKRHFEPAGSRICQITLWGTPVT